MPSNPFDMTRPLKTLIGLALAAQLALTPGASAGGTMKRLGTDAALDAPPGLDLTYLDVGAADGKLEIRLGNANMLPGTGGYPLLPGIEWSFTTGGRTFVAEAVATQNGGDYYLFEATPKGFQQLESPTGTYDFADGYASVVIPFKTLGIRKGSVIRGADTGAGADVDAHVHLGPITHYADTFATTKKFVVP